MPVPVPVPVLMLVPGLGPPFELLDILLSLELDPNPHPHSTPEFDNRPRSTHDKPTPCLDPRSHHFASTGPCFVSSTLIFLLRLGHSKLASLQASKPGLLESSTWLLLAPSESSGSRPS